MLDQFDDTHARDKSLYLTWLASSYLQASEIEQAARTLDQAINLAAGVASVRPSERITQLARSLQPHRNLAEVAAVLDKVA